MYKYIDIQMCKYINKHTYIQILIHKHKTYKHIAAIKIALFVFLGYSCALVGDILLQGHLYVTENYFGFHSNVFGYVTRVS